MTNANSFVDEHGKEEATFVDARPNRPARHNEIKMVHTHLMNAVAESEYYSAEFKAYETGRLSVAYLRNLITVDPRHVLILLSEGEPVGIQITGPELGAVWLFWTYVFPEARKRANPIRFLPALVNTWNNDRFHKIATYTKPDNRVAIAMCRRAKFTHIATLENHIFGEDYMLWESPLTKGIDAYDHGMGLGLAQRLGNRFLSSVGL